MRRVCWGRCYAGERHVRRRGGALILGRHQRNGGSSHTSSSGGGGGGGDKLGAAGASVWPARLAVPAGRRDARGDAAARHAPARCGCRQQQQ